MQSLFKNFKIKESKHRIDWSYQELGIEMQGYFPPKDWRWMWSLFHDIRFNENKIIEGFRVCKEKGVYTIPFIIGVMNKL